MSYNRRIFLKELGIMMTLPLLPSLMSSRAFAQQQATVKDKFIGVFSPNGAHMPGASNGNWNFAQALSTIAERNRPNVSIIRGLTAASNMDPHWDNTSNFLTGHPIQIPSRAVVRSGKSFDQMVADLHPGRQLRSLHVGWKYMNRNFTGDHPTYSDQYLSTLSWRAADRPVSNIYNPQQLYSQIFSSSQLGQQRLQAMNTQKSSVLDLTSREIASIKSRASQDDRLKLEGFEDNLRTLERDISRSIPACTAGINEPVAVLDYQNHFITMQRMIATAMQCDLISSATIMYDDGVGDVRLRLAGNPADHHSHVHEANLTRVTSLNNVHAALFSNLLDELKSRTQLEKTVVVWSSNMSDGSSHSTNNIPTVIASAGPGLRVAPEIGNSATPVPRSNLFVELAPLYGLTMSTFGSGRAASNGTRIVIRT